MSYTTSFNQGGELLEGTLLALLLHLTYPAPLVTTKGTGAVQLQYTCPAFGMPV